MQLLSQLEIGYVTHGGVVPSNMCIISREKQLKVITLLCKTSKCKPGLQRAKSGGDMSDSKGLKQTKLASFHCQLSRQKGM